MKAIALALLLAFTGGAARAQDLPSLLRALPPAMAAAESGELFGYADLAALRPHLPPLGPSPGAMLAVPMGDVPQVLLRRDDVLATTGFDLDGVQAMLTFAAPPRVIQVFLGAPAMTARMEATLAARPGRQYGRSAEGGWTVLAWGRDYELNLMQRDPDDPFGGLFGMAQRFALAPGRLVAARAWPDLRPVLAGLAEGAAAPPFVALVQGAVAALLEPRARVLQAAGYTAATFAGGPAERALLDALARGERPRLPAASGKSLPPFLVAILAAVERADHAAAVIVAAFPGAATAAEAGATIAERLRAFRAAQGWPAPGLQAEAAARPHPAQPDVSLAVVSLRLPPGPVAASAELHGWMQALYSRSFDVLNLGQ